MSNTKKYVLVFDCDYDGETLKALLDNKFRHLKFSLHLILGKEKTIWVEGSNISESDFINIGMAIKEYEIKQAKKKAINDAEIPLVLSAIERQIRMEEARISQRAIQIANQDKVLFNEPLQNSSPDYAAQLKIALEILKQPA